MLRSTLRIIAVGTLCALVCSCGSSSKQEVVQPVQPPQALPNDGTPELLRLMNEARKKKRLPQLTIDSRLTLAAKDHSNSMAKYNYFAHKGRDGKRFHARMARHGYPLSHSSENLAIAPNAQRVFQRWWDSKGHKTNMMNGKYTRVGLFRTGNYWTAHYAAAD